MVKYDTHYMNLDFLRAILFFLDKFEIKYQYDENKELLEIDTNVKSVDVYNVLDFLVIGALYDFEKEVEDYED